MGPYDSLRYFPGDPPVFETLGTFALLGLVALALFALAGLLLTSWPLLRRFRRSFSRLTIVLGLCVFAVLAISFLGILRRQFGEWARLKALLIEYSEKVERAHEKRGSLSLAAIEMEFLTPAPEFKFKELRNPVRLRIMQTTPPYVGVDFGEGANAVFDPKTMICLYSD